VASTDESGAHVPTPASGPTPTPGAHVPTPTPQRPPLNGAALFSFIASLLGLAMVVPIAGSIIGIIFGKRAMDQVDESGERGGGLAQAAVIFGYFGLVTLGLVLIMVVIILVAAKTSTT